MQFYFLNLMKKLLMISFLIIQWVIPVTAVQDQVKLTFNRQGEFKIVQFTDLHWNPQSASRKHTIQTIQTVIREEQPDLIVLTGDIVTNSPAIEGWKEIVEIFENEKITWTITLGNHDDEAGISRSEIFEFLQGKPYFIGEKGTCTYGAGNFTIPVYNSTGHSIASVLYCIDSNGQAPLSKYGSYDWIHFEQIEWYRNTSKQYTSQNKRSPLPSLAFFHIPIQEYQNIVDKSTTVGTKGEGVSSSTIHSGILSSMVEMGDIMGIFVGHDHNNNYIGIEHDIALAFGQVTGNDAYGKLKRGGRVIKLYENKFQFDTWIRTEAGKEFIYYYPSGLSSIDEENMTYLPAQNVKPHKKGVKYAYYEGKRFKSVDQLQKETPVRQGSMDNFSIQSATAKDSMGFVFESWIDIPERSVYHFYTFSDDGSKLFIDDRLVVDNDGSHNNRRKNGKIALEKGLHQLKVLYFEDYMGEMLEVGISSRNIRESKIPDEWLFICE